eukprot:gene15269-biopygen3664
MPAPCPRHARTTPAPLMPNRSLPSAPRPRHARATPAPPSCSPMGGYVIYGQSTGNYGHSMGNLRAITGNLRVITCILRAIAGDLRAIYGQLRAIYGQLRGIYGQSTGVRRHRPGSKYSSAAQPRPNRGGAPSFLSSSSPLPRAAELEHFTDCGDRSH